MALTVEDRRKIYQNETVREFRQKILGINLWDNSNQAAFETSTEVIIPDPNWEYNTTANPDEGVGTSDRTRGGNWPAPARLDADTISLTRSGGKAQSNEILAEDISEVPWDLVGRLRSRQSYVMRKDVNKEIFDGIQALPSSTISIGAADTYRVKKAAPHDAVIPTGSQHPVYAAIQEFALQMYRANIIDGEASPTGGASQPFMVLQPELIASMSTWLLDKGLSFDPLTAQLLTENPSMTDRGYKGTLLGVNLYAYNDLAVPTGVAWTGGYAGVREAATVATKHAYIQMFPPEENQISLMPALLMRQAVAYGFAELVNDIHFKVSIRAGSD